MMREIGDLICDLPRLVRCDSAAKLQCELLVMAAGFEDRALAIFEHIEGTSKAEAIILRYLPQKDENRLEDIVSRAEESAFRVGPESIVDFDRLSVDGFAANLRAQLVEKAPTRVVLDISAMSKMAIMLSLDVAVDLGLPLTIFYSEARDYWPSIAQFRSAQRKGLLLRPSLQTFSGVYGAIRAARLSSVAMQGQPTASIVFMSLNELITQCLLDSISPSRLFLINGRPPILQWREQATAWIHETLRREWPSTDNPTDPSEGGGATLPARSTSTLYYSESVKVLLDLYWELSVDHRIVLAPTGSKMQAVGAYLFKALHRDVHIEYPTPKGFLRNYSKGVGRKWLIDLGNVRQLVGELRRKENELMLHA